MYESKNEPLLPAQNFRHRLFTHVFYALLVMIVTLAIGVFAHLLLEPVTWHEALLNSALIVGGIGPYIVPESIGGKVFFAFYSMFVGLVFIGTLGIILAPLAHRLIHKFHLDDDQDE
ncbi:two pore domain potassium channel family protein [Advenella sp. WQ 585]|uniref:Two pore domain potassium channel family protein n=1 Tax=Advenella mandrilli TaxID=2800330 RepID=A0ABS1EEQ0_9BURK|nr:two pore domain potassium channel family protein [Advenella mandrilli]MBK1781708.1 two pore domain potassium channel family protein [Advenella mandrilli]